MDVASRAERMSEGTESKQRFGKQGGKDSVYFLIEHTTDAVFCYEYDPPISIDLPVEEQVELLYDGTLVMCNDVCAKSYGAGCAAEVIGKKLTELIRISPESIKQLFTAFIQGGYRIVDGESVEDIEDGTERYFLSNAHAVVEKGNLHRVWGTFRDITELKKKELALKASEERYRSLIDNIPGVVWTSDPQGRTTFISSNVEKLYGYTREEIYEQGEELWFGRIHPDDVERVKTSFNAVFEEGVRLNVEYRILKKDGQWIWVYDRSFGAYERDGVMYADGVFYDITERKQAEEALKESETSFRDLSNAAFEGIAFSKDGVMVDANEAFIDMFGYRLGELKDKPVVDLVAPEDRERVLERVRMGFEGTYEHKGLRKDGSMIDLEVHGRSVTYRGRIMRLTAIRDITGRKQAEKKLREYQEQLKSLASEVSLAEERERRRIAVGLHDDIAQRLAMVKLELQSLQASISDAEVKSSLKKQCSLMDQIVADTQSLTFELSNPVLYQFGLEAAVESYLMERIQEGFGIKCIFSSQEPRHRLDEDIRVVLFQATRELLANIVKHASADRVNVFIDTSGNRAQVVVEDNGIGFDPDAIGLYRSKGGGFGLFNVRERLEYLGGQLSIDSRPEKGVRITMTVPVKAGAIV